MCVVYACINYLHSLSSYVIWGGGKVVKLVVEGLVKLYEH